MGPKSTLRYALASSLLATISAPAFSFGIGLQPTTVEMSVQPGDRQRQVINLGNVHMEDTISLTLGLADWSLDEQGQIVLNPPGESPTSAADWVRFSPAFVTLKPGETEQVIVDLAAPMRVERQGDFRFALIASTLLPEERAGQSGVWKKYQIASLFYLTLGQAESRPVVKQANLTVAPDGQQFVVFDLENSGNAHARLRGEVEISGDSGDKIIHPIGNLVVLDEAAREYRMQVTQELPSNPEITISLENIFAPQSASGSVMLTPFSSDLSFEKTALPVLATENAEITIE